MIKNLQVKNVVLFEVEGKSYLPRYTFFPCCRLVIPTAQVEPEPETCCLSWQNSVGNSPGKDKVCDLPRVFSIIQFRCRSEHQQCFLEGAISAHYAFVIYSSRLDYTKHARHVTLNKNNSIYEGL